MKYYVIERTYIGFNREVNIDADHIEITTEAEESASFNDWRSTNLGSFETVDAAREFIADRFGVTRTTTPQGEAFVDVILSIDPESVIEIHKPGAYEPMSVSHSQEWAMAGFEHDIEAATTDYEIVALIEEYAAEARNQGYELDTEAAEDAAREFRDEQRKSQE